MQAGGGLGFCCDLFVDFIQDGRGFVPYADDVLIAELSGDSETCESFHLATDFTMPQASGRGHFHTCWWLNPLRFRSCVRFHRNGSI